MDSTRTPGTSARMVASALILMFGIGLSACGGGSGSSAPSAGSGSGSGAGTGSTAVKGIETPEQISVVSATE
ncbi:MAG: hypothetical protein H6934_07520 [Burkholderiaceae bacterium]|nr:hypothetical protein [Burkholderiaceae bacterium]